MQKALIDFFSKQKLEVLKGPIALSELGSADEIFLCNMVKGIMPVADFQNKKYLSAVFVGSYKSKSRYNSEIIICLFSSKKSGIVSLQSPFINETFVLA